VSGKEEGMDWEIQNLVGIIFHTIFQIKALGSGLDLVSRGLSNRY
jgi:hypothetical protein